MPQFQIEGKVLQHHKARGVSTSEDAVTFDASGGGSALQEGEGMSSHLISVLTCQQQALCEFLMLHCDMPPSLDSGFHLLF